MRSGLRAHISAARLALLLGGSGVLHLVLPEPYRAIIPAPLRRWAGPLVALSGLAEILCAGLLLVPRSRQAGGRCSAALLIAVFPANVQMALDWHGRPHAWLAWARLPLQAPLVWWAWQIGRRAGPDLT